MVKAFSFRRRRTKLIDTIHYFINSHFIKTSSAPQQLLSALKCEETLNILISEALYIKFRMLDVQINYRLCRNLFKKINFEVWTFRINRFQNFLLLNLSFIYFCYKIVDSKIILNQIKFKSLPGMQFVKDVFVRT